MSKILLAGNDFGLLTTRATVLATTSASVVCCNALEAMKVIESETFNLVVLCHSLTETQAAEITAIIHRRKPKTRVLLIVSDVSGPRSYGNIEFDATSSPDPSKLIHTVSKLLETLPNHRIEEQVRPTRYQPTS